MKAQEVLLRKRSAGLTKDLLELKQEVTLLSGQVIPVEEYLAIMDAKTFKPIRFMSSEDKALSGCFYDMSTKPTPKELDGFPEL